MPKFKIFYSWQSDLPGNKTRNFIRDCIDDAIAFAEESEAIEAVRDEATKDTTGSPNIVTTLFSKIDECDLFVADVSLCFTGDVKKEQDGRELIKHSPNPNVLIELGYAVRILNWEHVICVCNTDYGTDFPFDIAQNRRLPYSLEGKMKADVRREVAKSIYSDIQLLREQPRRAKAGMANHIIGTYNFEQQKVIGALAAFDIGRNEIYQRHNEELLEDSKELLDDIKVITDRLLAAKTKEVELKKTAANIEIPALPALDRNRTDTQSISKEFLHVFADSYKASETPVIWKDKERDTERIRKWLGVNVEDDFFYLGELKKAVQFLNQNVVLHGTEDEKAKHEKLEKITYNLALLEARTDYLETFDGMCFIPLAIQNVSRIADSDIRVVVKVETGEPVDPDEELIFEEFNGIQGLFCRNDDDQDDIGIIAELFLLEEDGVIHAEEEVYYPSIPKSPILTEYGFRQPDKTKEDYKLELEEYIASTQNRGYYEFNINSLRPNECKWMSTGMLIRPVNGQVIVSYRIHSAHSTGELSGKLELIHR